MADLSNLFTGLLSGAGALALGENVAGDLAGAGLEQQQQLRDVAQDVRGNLEFRPFTVTSGTGSRVAAGPTGGLTTTLSPQEQALQNQSLTGASSFLGAGQQYDPAIASQRDTLNRLFGETAGQISPDLTSATQSIYDQLQSITAPSQERARLGLEERLFGQGRTGVSTAAYGGTPEQLALEKAIQEQTSANAFTARQQALQERESLFSQLGSTAGLGTGLAQAGQGLQSGNIGLGSNLLAAAYTPQNQAIANLSPAVNLSNIGAGLQQQAGVTQAQLGQSGAEAVLQGRQLGTELQGTILAGLLDSLTTPTTSDPTSSIVGGLGNLLGGLFDGNDGFNIEDLLIDSNYRLPG
jgi:hypothetical protein